MDCYDIFCPIYGIGISLGLLTKPHMSVRIFFTLGLLI